MKFLVRFPATVESEAGVLPSEDKYLAMLALSQEMIAAGVLLKSEGLHPSSLGARLTFADGKATVRDGRSPRAKN